MSSKRLQDMSSRHLQDMSPRRLQDMSSRRLQDMSARRLQDVFKTNKCLLGAVSNKFELLVILIASNIDDLMTSEAKTN